MRPAIPFRLLPALAALVALPLVAQPPADLQLHLVADGFSASVAARHAGDGSGRLFIVERAGRIRIYDGTSVLADPFLDIEALVDDAGGEQGLLGLAFHPDYAANGFFYVNYTRDGTPDQTVIARYRVSAVPDLADAGSATELLAIDQDFANHNGGDVHFGRDGYLYVGMGDGGSGGDPFNRAQDLGSLLGKMLRLDVDGGAPYVPPDNPFVGDGSARDEIWAYGLRNPWRFSFDRLTGDLLIADVGQNAVEEIDFQSAASAGGENYGWDCYEGSEPYTGGNSGSVCSGPLVDPILEYGHDQGCSVTGGFRYRGHRIVGLWGVYVYADFCSNRMWLASETSPGVWSAVEWSGNTASNVSSFGEDEAGELYVVSLGGSVHRLVSPSSIFADGFESGDTAAWASGAP